MRKNRFLKTPVASGLAQQGLLLIYLCLLLAACCFGHAAAAGTLVYVAEGVVVNEDTRSPISGAEIHVYNRVDGQEIKLVSDEEGHFTIVLQADKVYEIRASHKKYFSDHGLTEIATISRTKVFSLVLPLKEILIGKAISINNIEFEVNDVQFTPESLPALDKLYKVLTDNPHIIIEIAHHTDSRGNDDYNLTLSQQRAEAIVSYLVSKGIEMERLVAKGYGETRLVNRCSNGVRCSGEEHRQNRRTEFVVIGIR